MIRFILVSLFLITFLILSIPIHLIEWIIGKFNPQLKNKSSQNIVQWAFKVILFISGVQLTIKGFDNVPKDKAVLYIGNHRSYFDIVITYSLAPGLTGYIAKKEMEHIPLLSTWMKFLHCLFLDRDNIKEGLKTILTGIEYIKSGISICIFPEGTRNSGSKMLPFKEGSLKMADKTGCPIIPFAMTNTRDIFENHFPKIKKTHVILEYGTPIYPKELDREQRKFLGAYTQNIIQEIYDENMK
ncbi:lysophospholipid acyltransferase family protein [Lachnotalea glycerini]|uniref:1-acyl-sn-glycerol-3-phosphate acyltransferase n=1 Tax=Lachnotalea glycerini TaxID=1763509 RepID=A0A371JE37_9FIRM|nr:lysophospholipid acyltransferase family protein [Lachnotalea glycerini]RDY31034.1 1-acyl-sn-glycerol-3-phosphate acyltransferase [Lachnotalea glycerini]